MPRDPFAGVVLAACQYEVVAIVARSRNRKPPTLTALCNRHLWLAPSILAALVVHFRQPLTALAREIR